MTTRTRRWRTASSVALVAGLGSYGVGLLRIAVAGSWDAGEECTLTEAPSYPIHDELDPVQIERNYLSLRSFCHWDDGSSVLLERADGALWVLAAFVVLALALTLRRRSSTGERERSSRAPS